MPPCEPMFSKQDIEDHFDESLPDEVADTECLSDDEGTNKDDAIPAETFTTDYGITRHNIVVNVSPNNTATSTEPSADPDSDLIPGVDFDPEIVKLNGWDKDGELPFIDEIAEARKAALEADRVQKELDEKNAPGKKLREEILKISTLLHDLFGKLAEYFGDEVDRLNEKSDEFREKRKQYRERIGRIQIDKLGICDQVDKCGRLAVASGKRRRLRKQIEDLEGQCSDFLVFIRNIEERMQNHFLEMAPFMEGKNKWSRSAKLSDLDITTMNMLRGELNRFEYELERASLAEFLLRFKRENKLTIDSIRHLLYVGQE